MTGELSGKIEGSLKDAMPLLGKVWQWTTEHYIQVMAFVVVLFLIGAWRRRRA